MSHQWEWVGTNILDFVIDGERIAWIVNDDENTDEWILIFEQKQFCKTFSSHLSAQDYIDSAFS